MDRFQSRRQQGLIACANPECSRMFLRSGDMEKHLKLSKSCAWFPRWKEAQDRQPTPEVVDAEVGEMELECPGEELADMPGLHDDFESDEEDGVGDGLDEDDGELAGAEGANGKAAEVLGGGGEFGADEEDSDEEEEEDADPGEVFRSHLEKDPFSFEDLLGVPELGQAGPGPATRKSRMRRMLGGTARFFDDDEQDDGLLFKVEHPTAGAPIRSTTTLHNRWAALYGSRSASKTAATELLEADVYRPFASRLEWELSEWMVKEGIGHGTFDRLLGITGLQERLNLSFNNTAGLHKKVDAIPPRAGKWHTKTLSFPDRPDDKFTFRHRDILEGIAALWGDPHFAEHLVYRPCRVFTDETKAERVFGEMWTGTLWWDIQKKLPLGSTMAALILSTDKTQLTQFSGNKVAYPVYLTLGNIPSRLRRKPTEQACVLIGYLPVEKVVKDGLSKRDVSSRYQRLFHAAMGHIVEPLKKAGKSGVELVGGDGVVRRVHPILVSYVADYPEQCLVACAKYGTCPKCFVSAKELGNPEASRARTRGETLKVMADARAKTTTSAAYFKSCMDHDVSGYVLKPFWTDLPYTDIHVCVTPDVLHQLYQGILKHVISWSQEVVGEQELDQRIRRLPRALGLRHFKGGIASLSQVTGSERKDMGKVLLGCLVGSRMTEQGITACRSILDFIYLAQYKSHTDVTLGYMSDALEAWHKNKAFFIKAGVRKHLHIPKFHSMPHYMPSIRLLGTTDNFNTEMFERLHIDFSKKGWRASNKRDAMPQMTSWVVRQENVVAFGRYIAWVQRAALSTEEPLDEVLSTSTSSDPAPPKLLKLPQTISVPRHPTAPAKPVQSVARQHRIPHFQQNLIQYLNKLPLPPDTPPVRVLTTALPFDRIDAYYSFKFSREGFKENTSADQDTVHASPLEHGRFDTVVVLTDDTATSTSLDGTRIGRIRLVFRIPGASVVKGCHVDFPEHWPRYPVAYIEWYTAPSLSDKARATHNMASVSVDVDGNGDARWSIVPLVNIRQSCMLFPDYKRGKDTRWDSTSSVLDAGKHFLVNNWLSLYAFQTIYM